MIASLIKVTRLLLPLILSLVLVEAAGAQDPLTVLPASKEHPPRKMLHNYLLAEAQKHFDARRAEIAALKTAGDIAKRQSLLRTKFIEALGGFPEKTPLNARTVGKEQRDGYSVERVIFESRPNHHVTATLYLPDGNGPFPGVLNPIGHSNNGKAADYIQRGCILLAKNGIAAFTHDPIGQGERRQLLDSMGKAAIARGTDEHTLIGVGALLVGSSTATYRIWDAVRAFDYLAGRPEIDAKRLGCTGCSGGGTETAYLMALDERVFAAAPSCYITSLERLFATRGPQDAEQNITGQVAFHMEHADYLNLRAPRPTLLCAASADFFDIQGTWTTFREATLVYGILGHSERVALAEYNTGHGFPRPQREAMVRWMRRWLLGRDDAVVEEPFALAKDAELSCTRSGQVLEDFHGKSTFHLNVERADELARQRTKAKRSRDEVLREARRLIALPAAIKPASMHIVGPVMRDGYAIRKLAFETEPGILVPGLHFVPDRGATNAPLVLYVHGRGKSVDAGPGGPIEKLVEAGNHVLALDLRGLGETAPGILSAKSTSLFGADFTEAFLALHLNRPGLGQRVYDLLAVIEKVAGEPDLAGRPLHVIGIESAGPVALHAAVLDARIRQLTLQRSLSSWSAVVRTPINYNQLTNVVPGALAVYDLPELAELITPGGVKVVEPASP